ncbi:MAG: 30S ribosomal protein S17 [Candidatus Cloacimonetes bacterium]|nr:30S ribosomal protein S17 [Candidatus Cloacimonadota bacterium]
MEKVGINKRKPSRTGVVISDKMDKTIVVRVVRQFKHPLYGKYIKKHKKYKVHDENNEAKTGDKVKIEEYRPVSKTKRWRFVEVIEKRR